ncbi:MAG: DNA-binding protein [Candidatus Bathyarchaeia archaeon]
MVEGRVGRIIFYRLGTGEDLIEAIKERAEKSGVRAGLLFAIGSLERATLGYYREGEYKVIRLDGPLEIVSCIGNIALDEKGEMVIHAHIVATNEKGEAFGGHLMQGSLVGATAELAIIEALDVNLKRFFDEKTRLRLLDL